MVAAAVVCALLAVPATSQDGPRVSAQLSTGSAAVGETVVLEIKVEGAASGVDITMPRIPTGLVFQGSQDFTEMHISFPGGRTETRRRELSLLAQAPGRYTIAPVTIRIGNKSYRTNALELTVSGSSQPRSLQAADDAWLRATMQPETVYVGQQTTLTVEAGFSEDVRVRLSRPPVFELPSPTGFWAQDVPGGVQSRLRAVNGRVTEIQSLQRAFFPLSAGRYAFASARAIIDVREGFLFAPETREIRSASPKVVVLPLPELGRPPDFKGAVGSFTIRASVQPDTVAAGEAAQITVELSGAGNLKAAPLPMLQAIPGVEQFAPTEDAEITFEGATVGGTKKFQWVIIPDRAGTVTIPPATYSFFEPATRQYRTIRTQPLQLHVRSAAIADEERASAAASLRAIRAAPRRASLQWVRTREFLLAQLAPLAIILAALLFMLWRRRPTGGKTHLAELKRVRQDRGAAYPDFLRELEAVLRAVAAERAGDAAVRTAKANDVAAALRKAAVAQPTIERLQRLIGRIEAARFAPLSGETAERESLLAEAEQVVRALIADSRNSQGQPAVFAILLLLQVQVGSFQSGVDLYRNGRFAAAATAFETAVARDSADVAAWSNLGNAYFRAGERGRAIWAWARAAREAPRDAAIVRNLRAAGAVEVLRTRPPLSVRPVEWYLLAAIGWWVAAAVALAAIVRRRTALLAWALPVIALVVIALAVGVIAEGREYAVALNDETRMYGDPTIHSPIVRRVQAGAGLNVLEQRGEWLRVRTVAHAEGWVEADAVGKL